MAEKAVSTINTILEISEDGKAWEKLCPIKNYPKLGGAPNQLETTDLEDESQTFINGVQSMDSMEFKANYLLETYKTVLAKSGIPLHYRLSMGKDGKDGVATWEGEHAVYVNEGEVNGVRYLEVQSHTLCQTREILDWLMLLYRPWKRYSSTVQSAHRKNACEIRISWILFRTK